MIFTHPFGVLSQLHVFGVRLHDHQILRTIIAFDAIDMMHALLGVQKAAKFFLGYQTMFKDIVILICRRVIGRIDEYVSGSLCVAASFPVRSVRAFLKPFRVTWKISDVLASVISALRMVVLADWRWLATATHAKARRIDRGFQFAAGIKHSTGGFSSGPMALNIGFARRCKLLTTAGAEISFHVVIIPH